MAFIKSDKALRMEKGGFIAIYNQKKVEIEADTLLEAKKKAIQELKVPKSKQGLLSVMSNASMANEDFRFMAKGGSLKRFDDKVGGLYDNLEQSKDTIEETQEFLNDIYGKEMTYQDRLAYRYAKGGKLPKTIKYYGVNEVKEYRLKNGDKIDPSKTFVDSGVYVSATKTMKPKEKEFQQKLEFKKGGATNWKGEKINWKEDYIYIPRFEIEEVELDNGKVIKGDYVVSGLYLPKSDRTKQLEKEMKARMKKMGKGGVVHLYFGGEQPDEVMEAANENEAASIAMKMGAEHYDFVAQMETGGTIVAADPSSAMEDLNQTYGYESVYEKGGTTPESIQRMQEKLINDLWDRKGYDISYLAELPLKQLKSLYDTEFYYEDEFFEKGGRLGFDGLAKKVAKRYEGKAVKPKYQEEYGKTYSKEEAMEVGRKVAAKVYGQQQAKMEMGGEITQPYSLINSGSADYVAGSNTMSNMFEKGGYLVRFEDDEQYASEPFDSLEEAKDFYEFMREQKAYQRHKGIQLVRNKDGKILMGTEVLPQLDSRFSREFDKMAKGGSLDGHGLQLGDKIVKDLGSILQVATKDGGMVYVDLASGYRGSDMPLPFEKGGQVYNVLSSYWRDLPDDYKKMGFTNRQAAEDFKSLTGLRDSEAKSIYAKLMQNPSEKFAKGGGVSGMKIPDIAKKFGKTTSDVFAQLQVGEKHEMEHTNDPKKARKIALDHLSKDLDYYTKLNKLGL